MRKILGILGSESVAEGFLTRLDRSSAAITLSTAKAMSRTAPVARVLIRAPRTRMMRMKPKIEIASIPLVLPQISRNLSK
jgi:hypothetical protein